MISVIICSIDDSKFAAAAAMYHRLLGAGGAAQEVIRIANARSMCEGYNRGVARSRGDVLIFSHDDVEILADDFGERLLGHLGRCDVLGVAGTTLLTGPAWGWSGPPHVYGQVGQPASKSAGQLEAVVFASPARHVGRMQALDGALLACRRTTAEAVPFDEETFAGFHHYDLDFTYRAFRAGLRLAVACDLDLIHHSNGSWGDAWNASARRFVDKHAATLPLRRDPARWSRASVRVGDREELRACFRPPHWDF